ncbi:hypothetical protein FA95DRAFT_1564465 [Auriscalpium vulgare]|uniref:Uncharacterized protein n=1 Tax=Auriscalpium vulgare TaxID=40419 RepID=A0ACB8REG5_9AGAM|nr:hypothetical protein FA95DRAFT_1564465 [Auriscalpium vulgare]
MGNVRSYLSPSSHRPQRPEETRLRSTTKKQPTSTKTSSALTLLGEVATPVYATKSNDSSCDPIDRRPSLPPYQERDPHSDSKEAFFESSSSSTITAPGKVTAVGSTPESNHRSCPEAVEAPATRDALIRLVKDHADLTEVDPAALTIALFNAMGYSNSVGFDSVFYPNTEFVIYLEFIEDKARGNSSRTHPAKSLSEAAHNFLSRPALPPAFTPSFPRNLATPALSEPIRTVAAASARIWNMNQQRVAECLFMSLGLTGFGPCPSLETVILLEFVAAQISDPTLHGREGPAKSMSGAVYYFLFRRAANREGFKLPRRSPGPFQNESWRFAGDAELLHQVDMSPSLMETDCDILSSALSLSIGLTTDPCPVDPDPQAVIQAEFLDDQRNYNPDRAVPARCLVEAAFNYLNRRSAQIPMVGGVVPELVIGEEFPTLFYRPAE